MNDMQYTLLAQRPDGMYRTHVAGGQPGTTKLGRRAGPSVPRRQNKRLPHHANSSTRSFLAQTSWVAMLIFSSLVSVCIPPCRTTLNPANTARQQSARCATLLTVFVRAHEVSLSLFFRRRHYIFFCCTPHFTHVLCSFPSSLHAARALVCTAANIARHTPVLNSEAL